MAEVELRAQSGAVASGDAPVGQDDEESGDLRDRISGVRLEVEKVRAEMAKMHTGLSDRISGVGLEVEKVRTEMTSQIGGLESQIGGLETRLQKSMYEKMGELETRLSEQIGGVEKSLRAWMALGVSFIAVLVALMSVINLREPRFAGQVRRRVGEAVWEIISTPGARAIFCWYREGGGGSGAASLEAVSQKRGARQQ